MQPRKAFAAGLLLLSKKRVLGSARARAVGLHTGSQHKPAFSGADSRGRAQESKTTSWNWESSGGAKIARAVDYESSRIAISKPPVTGPSLPARRVVFDLRSGNLIASWKPRIQDSRSPYIADHPYHCALSASSHLSSFQSRVFLAEEFLSAGRPAAKPRWRRALEVNGRCRKGTPSFQHRNAIRIHLKGERSYGGVVGLRRVCVVVS